MSYIISEFGIIRNKSDYAGIPVKDAFNEVYLPSKPFESLMRFIAENNDPSSGIDQAFSVHLRNGKYFICVKNFVGLIETQDGTTLEILPKIFRSQSHDDQTDISYCRNILLRMLRCLKDSPFIRINQASLRTAKLPILEIFTSLFLDEFELILQRGIKQHYVTKRENEVTLKGRLLIEQHVRQNFLKKQFFFVEYDEFQADIPQNRILKAALTVLNTKTRSTRNRLRLVNYLALLDEIPLPGNLEKDLQDACNHSRLFNYYKQALQWARIFLKGESFTSFKGKEVNQAILFPMEQLFEAYVADQFRRSLTKWDVQAQDRIYHLIENHNGERKFRLRPDMVVSDDAVKIVADTKWKIVNQHVPAKNYLISQADLYQLYAYGKKYQQEGKEVRLMLIYPKHIDFTRFLTFEYDSGLRIDVVPYDFEDPEIQCFPCFLEYSPYPAT